jgi:hypothetical protein
VQSRETKSPLVLFYVHGNDTHETEVAMTSAVHIPEEFYEAKVAHSALYRSPELQIRALRSFRELQVRQDIAGDYHDLYEDGHDLGPLVVEEETDEQGEPTGRMLLADSYHLDSLCISGKLRS